MAPASGRHRVCALALAAGVQPRLAFPSIRTWINQRITRALFGRLTRALISLWGTSWKYKWPGKSRYWLIPTTAQLSERAATAVSAANAKQVSSTLLPWWGYFLNNPPDWPEFNFFQMHTFHCCTSMAVHHSTGSEPLRLDTQVDRFSFSRFPSCATVWRARFATKIILTIRG